MMVPNKVWVALTALGRVLEQRTQRVRFRQGEWKVFRQSLPFVFAVIKDQ